MSISLLGNIYSTDYDYYITHLGTKIDTNGDGQVMKMDIQQHIKELMAERGWTNYRLGKEASLSHSTITNLFKRNNAPTIPTLEAVCRAFGITLSQFFSEGNTVNNFMSCHRFNLIHCLKLSHFPDIQLIVYTTVHFRHISAIQAAFSIPPSGTF